ncbi:hypothetical protein CN931_08565 [Bacillus sp. AFS054943]|uniref:IDEAL domain-containing protein n=1 Tax=Bacillus cereus TaxID=1396 RepID=A0A2C1LNH9_BACCE|nr:MULTISPECIES: hypothetical protein [Bacillus]PGL85650.1 hypothetical protein CN931_08565 [Bacillus sp. AFS054943]PGT99438.1 hypothetical protein COD19_19145 [Bacillus cereus]TKI39935.1 hypothetical protein FC700_21005 [Bacillus mycoides]
MITVNKKKKLVAWIIGNIHFQSEELAGVFHRFMKCDYMLNNIYFISDEEFEMYSGYNSVLQFKINEEYEEIINSVKYTNVKNREKFTTSNLDTIKDAIRINSSTLLAIYIQKADENCSSGYKALTTIPFEDDSQDNLSLKINMGELDAFLNQILENGRNEAMYNRLINNALDTNDEALFYRATKLLSEM